MKYTGPRAVPPRPLDSTYFPSGLKYDPSVSPTAKMVAGMLAPDDEQARADLIKTHRIETPPTQEMISAWLGVSVRTVSKCFRELVRAQYLVMHPRRQGRPWYQFTAPQMRLEFAPISAQAMHMVAELTPNQAMHMVAYPAMHPCAYRSNVVVTSRPCLDIKNDDDDVARAREEQATEPAAVAASSSSSSFFYQTELGMTEEWANEVAALVPASDAPRWVAIARARAKSSPSAWLYKAVVGNRGSLPPQLTVDEMRDRRAQRQAAAEGRAPIAEAPSPERIAAAIGAAKSHLPEAMRRRLEPSA